VCHRFASERTFCHGPPVRRAPFSRDVAVLMGVLAVLEGGYLAGDVPDYLIRRIGDRFARHGLLAEDFEPDDVRGALNAMNDRLRCARGERDEPSA
jgi:hypothetical protein